MQFQTVNQLTIGAINESVTVPENIQCGILFAYLLLVGQLKRGEESKGSVNDSVINQANCMILAGRTEPRSEKIIHHRFSGHLERVNTYGHFIAHNVIVTNGGRDPLLGLFNLHYALESILRERDTIEVSHFSTVTEGVDKYSYRTPRCKLSTGSIVPCSLINSCLGP